MSRQRRFRTALVSLSALAVLAAGSAAGEPLSLEEADLFFELNDTDGDLGIHASIDGGPYTRLEIEDPWGRSLLVLGALGNLAKQGMTQLAFESAEPSFDELSPADFFRRFPEGEYEIEVTRGRKEFETTAELSHVLAAPPETITVDGVPAAEDCDDFPLPVGSPPVLIDWSEVTESHDEIGTPDQEVEIERWQFFVEQGDLKLGVDLPPEVTEFEIPISLTAGGGVFKYEIIARTSEGNNTAVETCFFVP